MASEEEKVGSPVIYSVKEYAALLKVDIETVYRWVRNGEVKSIRHGRTIRILKSDFNQNTPSKNALTPSLESSDITQSGSLFL